MIKVPRSDLIRQRLDAKASELRELTDELSVRKLERAVAPFTPYKGFMHFRIGSCDPHRHDETGADLDHETRLCGCEMQTGSPRACKKK